MKKLIIIDGYSLLFRAYYATAYKGEDTILRTTNGTPINAVFTFGNMLFPILQKLSKEDGIIVALDTGHKTKRHDEFIDYKANRTSPPESLKVQFPIIREFLDSLNIFHYEEIGYEADDIAGSVAKKAEKDGIDVEIYTSDHDYLQLVDDKITVNIIKKGIKDIIPETPKNFVEINGILPSQIPDFKGLRGDSSDNLPGIKGVGDKTANDLLNKYSSFDDIYDHINEIKGKLKDNLLCYKDQGIMCKHLAIIEQNVALPFETSSLMYKGYKPLIAKSFIDKYEMKSLTAKLVKIKEFEDNEMFISFNETSYEIIDTCINLENEKELGFAANFQNNDPHNSKIIGFSFYSKNQSYYIDFSKAIRDPSFKKIIESNSINKYVYEYKPLRYILRKNGILLSNPTFNITLAVYMLDSNIKVTPKTCFLYFGLQLPIQESDSVLFTTEIAKNSFLLKDKITAILKQKELFELFNNVELPLSKVLCDMEFEGFPIDKNFLLVLKKEYMQNISELEKTIHLLSGQDFNISSPSQVQQVLLKVLNLNASELKDTSVDTLKHYEDNPLVSLILEYRKNSKMLSTYVIGLLDCINKEDNKIHCIFNQVATTTGRLSSSNPNLQNISVRDPDSKIIRKAFYYSDSNYTILSYDYSQIELRLLAHISNCQKLKEAFINGEDIHSATARHVFKTNDVTPLQRRKAKAVNFGIVYGISAYGLKEQVDCSLSEAKEIIDEFYKVYPEVSDYANNTIDFLKKHGYVKTIFNRVRYLPEIFDGDFHKREFAKRAAINVPIQGSAADLIKIAMIKIYDLLTNYDSKMVLQIHDELIFKMNVNEIDELAPKIKDIMENVIHLDVPLIVDGGHAKTWYDIK